MNRIIYLFVFILCQLNLSKAQNIPRLKTNDLQYWTLQNSDTIFVINFWATWCKPCISELNSFEKINKLYADKKVKVILINNDFKKQYETRLKPFVKEKNIKSSVFFMDESNPNSWIDRVNTDWGGAIPATWIIQKSSNYEKFIEGSVSFEKLKEMIDPLIK
ncbi:MAG: TlpA family protein disulfide reductase [Bacteroidia bacterium]|nr:TlpA family protein disulfide reductase [Bacteroidia bacterium]